MTNESPQTLGGEGSAGKCGLLSQTTEGQNNLACAAAAAAEAEAENRLRAKY